MKTSIRPRLIIRQRDLTILRLLYEYRFLDIELIWHLITSDAPQPHVSFSLGRDGKRRPTTYGFGRQALYKRLRQLFNAGLVKRYYLTDLPLGRSHGSPRAIYGLGSQSPKLLQTWAEIPAKDTRKMIESNRVKSPFLRHSLETARFRVVLELACRKSKGKVTVLFWQQGNSIRDSVAGRDLTGKKTRFPIRADAFFGLKLSGGKRKHFFLEIDRGTEPIVSLSKRSDIRKKLLGYEYYRRSRKIAARYPYYVRGFEVLIVTLGKLVPAQTSSGRIFNIMAELCSHKHVYRSGSLFRLTTPKCVSLQRPETVFEKGWISPHSPSTLLRLFE